MIKIFTDKTKDSATARFRGFFVYYELINRGIEADLFAPMNNLSSRRFKVNYFLELFKTIKTIANFNQNDVIYLVRTVYSVPFVFIIIFFCKVLKKKYIFDFDDAIYLKPRVKLQTFLLTKFASHVVVGSSKLFEWAELVNPKVSHIPTVVPYEKYNVNAKSQISDEKLTIGWIGHAVNHINNLKLLVPVFQSLIAKGVQFRFILIGGLSGSDKRLAFFKKIDGYDLKIIENLDWHDPEAPSKAISKFDIGVMPLVKNSKTEAKCSFKIIEYMASSVVAIASDVGENKVVIKDGYDGFLPKNSEEWASSIENIYLNPLLKNKIASRGSKKIKEFYSYESTIPKILGIVKLVKYEN